MAQAQASAYYSPYGAYELKATYQRHLGYGMLVTIGLVAALWLSSALMVDSETVPASYRPARDTIIVHLQSPQSISRPPEEVVVAPPPEVVDGTNFRAVADSLLADEGQSFSTQAQLSEMQPNALLANDTAGAFVVVATDPEDYLPPRDSFIPYEKLPELIHTVEAEFPLAAQQLGLYGTVVIQALVGKDGTVLDVVVARSSGTTSLDDAAVAAAWKYRYKPAIQNDRSVAGWVSYKVEFLQP